MNMRIILFFFFLKSLPLAPTLNTNYTVIAIEGLRAPSKSRIIHSTKVVPFRGGIKLSTILTI
jgi:hypothetical protein